MADARKVRLFYLKDSLRSTAEKLEKFFRTAPTIYDNSKLDSRVFSQSSSIHETQIELLSFQDLIAEMDGASRHRLPRQTDVFIILGHSNVFNFGPLAIPDILEALSHPTKPPSLIAFLGCCGGNPRYGPLTMLSQLPEWQNTVFSFFQRRIYREELYYTVPVLLIQYFLHLMVGSHVGVQSAIIDNFIMNLMIQCSVRNAYSDGRCDKKRDAAFFLNLKELSTTQKFLNMIHSVPGINILTEEIPLSCWQLEMFHTFTVEIGGEEAIKKFINYTEGELKSIAMQSIKPANAEVKNMLMAKVDEECKAELKRRRLYNIIELACELQLMQVTTETFTKLRNNKWRDVDHLQFFVAMLQGYWGKNDYEDLREYATYHLVEIIKSTDKNELREYQLCCVGYCLFSPETYIITDESNKISKKFGICLWRGEDEKIPYPSIITSKGYEHVMGVIRPQPTESITVLPQNDDELPWFNLFDLICRKDDRFVELYKKPVQGEDSYYRMHSSRQDDCDEDCSNNCFYEYKHKDLEVALKALQDYGHANEYLFNCKSPSCDCQHLPNKYRLNCLYDVTDFHNKENRSAGHMQCFPHGNNIINCKFIEMRVAVHVDRKLKIDDAADIDADEHLQHKELVKKHLGNWKKISRCRFIFACYHTYNENDQTSGLKGILFFTDSHYGEDKIKEENIEKKLTMKEVKFDGWSYFQKVKKLLEVYKSNRSVWYDLQEELVKEGNYYPFNQIGGLTIKRTGTPTLEKIKEKKKKQQ